jgi:phospholipase C
LLENVLSHKTGKKIEEPNISLWRRTVCGDLSSVFKPYSGEKIPMPSFPSKDAFLKTVHQAKFKAVPAGFKKLSKEEIIGINRNPASSPLMPQQEKGIRPSCALPYQLAVDGKLSADRKKIELKFEAKNELFGKQTAGSPFNVYAPVRFLNQDSQTGKPSAEDVRTWAYTVAAGDQVTDAWQLESFENGQYHLRVYGPNGFFREFLGTANDPAIGIVADYSRNRNGKPDGNLLLRLSNLDVARRHTVEVRDNAYKKPGIKRAFDPRESKGSVSTIILDLGSSFGWYDFTLKVTGAEPFERRFAGRVETGRDGFSDPAMGRIV